MDMSRRSFLKGMGAFGLAAVSAGILSACSQATGGATANANANTSGNSASNASNAANATSADANSATAAAAGTASGKILVAYFSGTGNTRRVAQELATDLNADIFEITPANPYTSDDLNSNNEDSRVVQEYQNQDQRDTPLSQNAPDNFADYDTVLVGYPIWWMDSAWAMHRFASDNDFTGKTVIPFCTSMSSPLGSSGSNLANLAGTGDWKDGQRFGGRVDLADVKSWAESLQA